MINDRLDFNKVWLRCIFYFVELYIVEFIVVVKIEGASIDIRNKHRHLETNFSRILLCESAW